MKTVILAEKPSVARDIARVLGVKDKGDGCIIGDQYIVTWALGHLVSLCEPDELDPAFKKWSMNTLPILPEQMKTKVLPKTRSQFSVVKKLLTDKETDRVICATDSGREGELIFRYIYEKAGCKKPVDRLWISSMTDAAIKEGFRTLKPDSEYDALYSSARCRSESDWLVGMNASRAFTLRYDALLSLGRVQTPTLALIVGRDKEIAEFVPKDYWEIRADFGDYTGLWLDPKTNEVRCYDREKAEEIKNRVTKKTGVITEVVSEEKRMPSPFLYDLTSLQRDANRKYGYSAAKTLELTQSLYETRKLVTYPRTDSRYLPHDMIPKVKTILQTLPEPYKALAQPVMDNPSTSGRIYDDAKISDHHAIIPTGNYKELPKLTPDERNIFDLIVRRFLSIHYPPNVYLSRRILTEVEGETFRSTGTTPIEDGWKALYKRPEDKEEDKKEEDQTLPDVQKGDTRQVVKAATKALKTKPPQPMNDASLLDMMEHAGRSVEDEALREAMKDAGLGTPATRAAIIERLIEVHYIARKGKTLISTEKGRRIISVVPEQLRSAETTGKWERALSNISKDTDAAHRAEREARFMDSIRRFSVFLVDAAKNGSNDVVFEKEEKRGKGGKKRSNALGKCPLCGGDALENTKAYYCAKWKDGCKFNLWKDAMAKDGIAEIDTAMAKKLLKGEGIPCDGGTAFLNKAGTIEVRV